MTDRGCFGLPSVYQPRSDTCKKCESHDKCRDIAHKVAQGLKGTKLPVEPLLRDMELSYLGVMPSFSAGLTAQQQGALMVAPSKIRGRLERLFREGFDKIARAQLARGENPFSSTGAKHLHLAGALLLQGSFTKSQFREECTRQLGWSNATASSESSQACALLRLLGIANERGDTLSIAQ